jgi:hypothetical protein
MESKILAVDARGAGIETTCTKRIRLMCPRCGKVGTIEVDAGIVIDGMRDRGDSMLALQVYRDEICEHEFTVMLDANFKAR